MVQRSRARTARAGAPFYKCLGLALGVSLSVLALFPRVFMENDDLGFIVLLSHGFYAPWLSKTLCVLLLSLYGHWPGLAWYGLLHYLILTLDLAVLLKLSADWAAAQQLSARTRFWLMVAAILVFYPFILRITFTSSSIWSAGLGLMGLLTCWQSISSNPGAPLGTSFEGSVIPSVESSTDFVLDSPVPPVTSPIGGWVPKLGAALGFGVVFSLGYLVRPEGLGAMIFLLPMLCYGIFAARQKIFSRQGWAISLVFLLPLLIWLTLDKAILHYPVDQAAYLRFVTDSNDAFGFGFTELFKTHRDWLTPLGWSRNDYGMLERFLYWDETVFSQARMTQLLQQAPQAFFTRLQNILMPSMFAGRMVHTLGKTWLSNFPFTVYGVGIFLLFGRMGTTRWARWFPGVALALIFTGSVLMQALLRFPYRVAYPLITVSALSLLALPGFSVRQLQNPSGVLKPAARWLLMLSALSLLCFNGPVRLWKTFKSPLAQTRAKLEALNQLQGQYYILREAGVIQISASDPLNPQPLSAPDIGPGWLIQSPLFYARLHHFGMTQGSDLMPASFNNPHILYFFKDKNLPVLQTYIAQHYHRRAQFIPVPFIPDQVQGAATFYGNSHLYRLVSPEPSVIQSR